jgi:hypothetical protein
MEVVPQVRLVFSKRGLEPPSSPKKLGEGTPPAKQAPAARHCRRRECEGVRAHVKELELELQREKTREHRTAENLNADWQQALDTQL